MKKFLKAVALATVMCMLLSVSAFADVDTTAGSATRTEGAKTIDVAVTGAGANNEVALLIVKNSVTSLSAVTDGDIMFIDQKPADGSGNINFGAVSIKDENETVDVYVGSAGFGSAKKIGENISLKDAAKITIAAGDAIKTAVGEGEGGKHGYAAAITANVPENVNILAVKWAFEVNGDWVYSANVEEHAGAVTAGDVTFAAAFDAYTEADGEFTPLNITDVAVIFLTGDTIANAKGNPDNTHYVAGTQDAIDALADDNKTATN